MATKKIKPKVTVEATPDPIDERVIKVLNRALTKFTPPEVIDLATWAERECYLPAEAGGIPGPYRINVTPFHRGILEAITDKRYDHITWLAGSQLGKTTLLLIACHYFMVADPSPILFIEPNESLSKDLSEQRFRPYIRDNRSLKSLLGDSESKSNITEKLYPGGWLKFGSSQTLTDLISRATRCLFMDETSSWPYNLKDKGNPISLAVARTASSFRDSRKVIQTSTPGVENLCNITTSYEKSDQRTYRVPCPFCSEFLEFELSGLEWEKDSEGVGAYYKCPTCASHIEDSHKPWMLANGYWHINNPEVTNHAGFKLNGFYSPFVTFEDIAIRYRAAKAKAGKLHNDYSDLIEFYNQTLALTWNDQHLSQIGKHDLVSRQEYYAAEVPAGVGLLTAGVDFQRDRAEVTVLGHGKYNQIWVINHYVIHGDPLMDPDLPSSTLWRELDTLLNKAFTHQSGKQIYIRHGFLDAGDGVTTQQVRKYCLQRTSRGLHATKGSRIPTDAIFPGKRFKDSRTGNYVGYEIGVNSAKDDLHHRLQITLPDAGGYIHFPNHSTINDDYFKQLTSENVVHKRNSRGVVQRVWEKRFQNQRNEAMDCFVLALACKLFFLQNKPADIIDQIVDTLNTFVESEPEQAPEVQVPTPVQPQPKPPQQKVGGPRYIIPRRAF